VRLVCVLCVLGSLAGADEVVLTGGGRLSGEVVEKTERFVQIRFPHGTMTIPRAKIARIVEESADDYLAREARHLLRVGSTRSAVEMYARAYEADRTTKPEYVGALLRHASELSARFHYAEARRSLARIAELEPTHAGAARLREEIASAQRAAGAIFERARRAYERGGLREALQWMDRWRVRRPLGDAEARRWMARLHADAASAAEGAGRLREALDHYRAAAAYGARGDAIDRGLYLLRPVAVLEALKTGDVEDARRLLDGIATTYPDASVPAFLQAVLHHVTGEVETSIRWYARAAREAEKGSADGPELDYALVKTYAAATLRAAVARPPQEGVARWREIFLEPLARHDGGRHFVVFAPTRLRAREVAERADERYEWIATELLGRVPDAPRAEIVVHPAREAYLAADPAPPGTPLAGVTIPRSKTSGVCYDTLDGKGAPLVRVETFEENGVVADTLPHELVHVVQRRGLAAFRRAAWLDEGLATLYESAARRRSRLALWRRLQEARIPFPELLALRSAPPGKVTVFYNESHALAAFLRGLGDERAWRTFLDTFARAPLDVALREAYGIESVDELERMFLRHP